MSLQHKTHFQLFDLPESFDVDMTLLADRYRVLQRETHPDRFAAAPEQEQRLAVQMAARINDAFAVLKSPLARGRYLLSLHGVDVEMEKNTAMDPAFLMEQMEFRERLEESRHAADPLAELTALGDELAARHRHYVQELGRCFDAGAADDLRRAAAMVRELQFINKLQEEVGRLEEQFL